MRRRRPAEAAPYFGRALSGELEGNRLLFERGVLKRLNGRGGEPRVRNEHVRDAFAAARAAVAGQRDALRIAAEGSKQLRQLRDGDPFGYAAHEQPYFTWAFHAGRVPVAPAADLERNVRFSFAAEAARRA